VATLTAPTQARLIQEVRTLLNQPKAENSRWADTEISGYLNDGIQRYFLHINEIGEGQFDTTTNLNITANTETVDLPSDCYSVKVLYKKQGDGTSYLPLPYRNELVTGFSSDGGGTSHYQPAYSLRGNKIVLHPTPGASETAGLRLDYTAFPEVLIYGADSLTAGISPVFKELVVMYAVYKCKLRDDLVQGGNTRSAAEALLADLYANFKHQVAERSKYPQFIFPFTP
jgi:hypothetical protein